MNFACFRFASGGADKCVIIWTSKLEGILKYSHNDAIQVRRSNFRSKSDGKGKYCSSTLSTSISYSVAQNVNVIF